MKINCLKFKKMKFKRGDECVLIKDTCRGGSNFGKPIGTIVYIISEYKNCGKNGYNVSLTPDSCGHAGYVYEDEIRLNVIKLEDLKKEVLEKELEIKSLKSKIEYLETYGIDTFDQEEFQAYQVLKVIGIDDIKKAREIVKILK